MHVWPVVDDAGNLRCKANRRTLEQAAGEADCPGVHLLFCRLLRWGASRRANALWVHIGCLRIHIGWLKHQCDRRQRGEQEQQAWSWKRVHPKIILSLSQCVKSILRLLNAAGMSLRIELARRRRIAARSVCPPCGENDGIIRLREREACL